MTGRGLRRLVAMDLRRSARPLAAAGVGISVVIAALVFFAALTLGLRAVLLGEIFPVDRIEVTPVSRNLDLLALRLELGSDTIGPDQIEQLAAIPGVEAVYPKMKLTVPALASGGESIFGSAMQTEIIADGVDPALVADEVGESLRPAATVIPVPCSRSTDCSEGMYCGNGVYGAAGVCSPYIPVLASHHLFEMYNGSFRRAYGLPRLNPDFAVGLSFEIHFGASTLRPGRGRVLRERGRLVGFSERAIPLGITMPIDVVRRVNAAFGGAGDAYHSALVEVESKRAVPEVVQAVEGMNLQVRDRGARRAATLLAVVLAAVALIGGTMLAVAAVSVGHAFFLLVMARRRELGLLRAVGARRGDIVAAILAEAGIVGMVAGAVGVAAAVAVAMILDGVARGRVPEFPYKPDSFFVFEPWLVAGAVALAAAACLLGAVLPARRAAMRDPADALTGR